MNLTETESVNKHENEPEILSKKSDNETDNVSDNE